MSEERRKLLILYSSIKKKNNRHYYGATHCKCACGTLYITTNLDKDGNLVKYLLILLKGGICQANLNAVTRMISLDLDLVLKLMKFEDQLKSIHLSCIVKWLKLKAMR